VVQNHAGGTRETDGICFAEAAVERRLAGVDAHQFVRWRGMQAARQPAIASPRYRYRPAGRIPRESGQVQPGRNGRSEREPRSRRAFPLSPQGDSELRKRENPERQLVTVKAMGAAGKTNDLRRLAKGIKKQAKSKLSREP